MWLYKDNKNNRDFVSLLEKDFWLNRLTKNYKG